MIRLIQQRVRSIKQRIRLLMLCWAGIFLFVMGVDHFMPYTVWGALVRLPVNFAVCPVAVLTGQYFIFGPRHARRYWLIFRFVTANCVRTPDTAAPELTLVSPLRAMPFGTLPCPTML